MCYYPGYFVSRINSKYTEQNWPHIAYLILIYLFTKTTFFLQISYFIRGNPFFTSSYELSKEINYKPNTQRSKESLDQIYYQCGKIQCYKEQGSVISLGRLR